jgi:hypothetical protein
VQLVKAEIAAARSAKTAKFLKNSLIKKPLYNYLISRKRNIIKVAIANNPNIITNTI